jgi:hypothetical protein
MQINLPGLLYNDKNQTTIYAIEDPRSKQQGIFDPQ